MESFNKLSLLDRCNILYDHGKFVFAPKGPDTQYAIYVLNKKYDFRYCVMRISKSCLTIEDVTALDNCDVAAYVDGSFIKELQHL